MNNAYQAATENAALLEHSGWGRLLFSGRDRVDFLQRMSTNDMSGLAQGQGRATVLTTAIGRTVDRLVVYADGEELLGVVSPGNAGMVRQWLGRHIFFMDQVKLTDASETTGMLRLVGPSAAAVLAKLLPGLALPAELHAWTRGVRGAAGYTVARGEALGAETFVVIGAREDVDALHLALLEAGVPEGDEALYEVLRVEAGLPRHGREMSEEYVPLEANLWSDVSFTKGCYIGQEIIARMESRGKQARALTGLRLAVPLAPGDEAKLYQGEQEAGRVTSAVVSPALGPIALAFVRPALATPGTKLEVRGPGGAQEATLESLPFPRS